MKIFQKLLLLYYILITKNMKMVYEVKKIMSIIIVDNEIRGFKEIVTSGGK